MSPAKILSAPAGTKSSFFSPNTPKGNNDDVAATNDKEEPGMMRRKLAHHQMAPLVKFTCATSPRPTAASSNDNENVIAADELQGGRDGVVTMHAAQRKFTYHGVTSRQLVVDGAAPGNKRSAHSLWVHT